MSICLKKQTVVYIHLKKQAYNELFMFFKSHWQNVKITFINESALMDPNEF